MFCPRCGRLMGKDQGLYRCEPGEMTLSLLTAEGLEECFIEGKRRPGCQPKRVPDGPWFCPRCGVAMRRGRQEVRCPRCRRCLNPFLADLAEFHPHRDERGLWPWQAL